MAEAKTYNEVFYFLRDSEYPKGSTKDHKRTLRRKARKLVLDNGLDERMNQTLKGSLVKFVNDNQDNWDVHIKCVLLAYRTSKNDSMKFTPFQLMFGRAPVLPIEMEIQSRPSSADLSADQVEGVTPDFEKVAIMMDIHDKVKAQAMLNIEKAQDRQKKAYDAKHQSLRFKEGDAVMLKNMKNEARKGGKLEQAWSGTYTVSRVLPKGVYKLRNDDGTELKTSYNSTRVKVYFQPFQSQIKRNPSPEKPSEPISVSRLPTCDQSAPQECRFVTPTKTKTNKNKNKRSLF